MDTEQAMEKSKEYEMENKQILQILKHEFAPALGCTEPVAIAYAAAKARKVLGKMPVRAVVNVSRNILKNAMGVGIPGTDMVGLEMAAALGIIGGDSDAVLEVLQKITKSDVERAEAFARERVSVSLKDTPQKLYIEIILETADDSSKVVIEDSHTNITKIFRGVTSIYDKNSCEELQEGKASGQGLTVEEIYRFVVSEEVSKFEFMEECIRMNRTAAEEGLKGDYGLNVGKSLFESIKGRPLKENVPVYAAAMAAAAADARMSGSTLPVMTVCGSGNQGLTATLPVIAAAEAMELDKEKLLRALALSCLTTIHVKQYIGKLSPLCGCGMGSSIGVCCALVYMQGGGMEEIKSAIRNMIADVSGIICDGAKAGCALKIGTVVSGAFQCSMLALNKKSAGNLDGIVAKDVESTIKNLGELGNRGMADTDRVILDMMVCS